MNKYVKLGIGAVAGVASVFGITKLLGKKDEFVGIVDSEEDENESEEEDYEIVGD